jgi:hypothetical protein
VLSPCPQSANVGLLKNRSGAKLLHYGLAKALKAHQVRHDSHGQARPDGIRDRASAEALT